MGKNASVGIKIANQTGKGAPKDGCFRDKSPVKNNPQNPYNNPAKATSAKRGVEAVTGKLGR